MSLKQKIKYYLEKNGYMSLKELENLCHSEQKKISNGERRLREMMKTEPILPVKNSAGAIIAYRWSEIKPIHPLAQDFLDQWLPKKETKKDLTLF
jgi:hypothetical protein